MRDTEFVLCVDLPSLSVSLTHIHTHTRQELCHHSRPNLDKLSVSYSLSVYLCVCVADRERGQIYTHKDRQMETLSS